MGAGGQGRKAQIDAQSCRLRFKHMVQIVEDAAQVGAVGGQVRFDHMFNIRVKHAVQRTFNRPQAAGQPLDVGGHHLIGRLPGGAGHQAQINAAAGQGLANVVADALHESVLHPVDDGRLVDVALGPFEGALGLARLKPQQALAFFNLYGQGPDREIGNQQVECKKRQVRHADLLQAGQVEQAGRNTHGHDLTQGQATECRDKPNGDDQRQRRTSKGNR